MIKLHMSLWQQGLYDMYEKKNDIWQLLYYSCIYNLCKILKNTKSGLKQG